MRNIIMTFFIYFCVVTNSFGLDLKIPKNHFILKAVNKYSSEWVRYFESDKLWICQTESMPYIELKSNPLSKADLLALPQNTSKKDLTCIDKVFIVDTLNSKNRTYVGCNKDRSFQNIIKKLNRRCRQ